MKTIHFLFQVLLVLLSFQLIACEDEMPYYNHEKEYALLNFTGVALGDALQVEIMQAADFRVVAKGEYNDLKDLELWVENNTLRGKYRAGSKSHKRTLVQVYMPNLTKANMHSATSTKIKGFPAQQEALHVIVSGASELELENSWKELTFEVSGASKTTLHGYSIAISANVSGNAELKAEGLTTKNCHLEVNGSSTAKVRVEEKLSGSVNGNSKLSYWGNPTSLQVVVATDSEMQSRN